MFGTGAACQLGVPGLIRPRPARTAVLDAYQEIGIAEPRACRQCCLVDQGDAALHRVDRGAEARFQRPCGDLDKIAAALLQPGQACCFMLMTFADDERGLRIVGGLGCSPQATASVGESRVALSSRSSTKVIVPDTIERIGRGKGQFIYVSLHSSTMMPAALR